MNYFPFFRAIFENPKMRVAIEQHGGEVIGVWAYMAGRCMERFEMDTYDFRCEFVPTIAAAYCSVDTGRLSAIVTTLVEVNMMQLIDGNLYILQLSKYLNSSLVTDKRRKSFVAGKRSALEKYNALKTRANAGVMTNHDSVMTNHDDVMIHNLTKPNLTKPNKKPMSAKTSFSDDDKLFAEWFYSLVLQVAPSTKQPNIEKWANTIRLMREIDKLEHRQMAEVFKFANANSFWSTNILSPKKFREKFATLEAKAMQTQSGNSSVGDANKQLILDHLGRDDD